MTIDTSPVNLTPDSVIMTHLLGVVITLELQTMKGKPYQVHLNQCFPEVATDYLEKPETLGDLVRLIMRRQHPQIQYIAEQNGIRVIQYYERNSFSQSMSAIEYDPVTKTLHV